MNNRRKLLIALGPGVFAAPFASFAQQPGKVWRIGYLAPRSRSTASNPDVYYDAFEQAMRELGYIVGKNLVIEWRFADGKYERLPGLAAELVAMKLELIATDSTPATQALKQATATIPIVVATMGDPVANGFAVSLARPGGNITGQSLMSADLNAKRFELLKLMMPTLARAAVLMHPGSPRYSFTLSTYQAAAQQLGVKVSFANAQTAEEIESGFAEMQRERAEAVIIPGEAFFIGQRRQIVELTLRHKLPSMFLYREDVQAGGLMSYGQNVVDFYRRTAIYVDKILKGVKPGDLPIEQPMYIHLAINRKTAKALGLTISQEMLARANEVIE